MVQNPLKTVKIGKNGKIDEHDHDGQFRFSSHCLNTDNFATSSKSVLPAGWSIATWRKFQNFCFGRFFFNPTQILETSHSLGIADSALIFFASESTKNSAVNDEPLFLKIFEKFRMNFFAFMVPGQKKYFRFFAVWGYSLYIHEFILYVISVLMCFGFKKHLNTVTICILSLT